MKNSTKNPKFEGGGVQLFRFKNDCTSLQKFNKNFYDGRKDLVIFLPKMEVRL